MANQAPDPKEFGNWQDAFDYPIPVVRKLEQQLRTNISDNREKVRSLVGSSYRDLLGTADRIIDMNTEMQQLEDTFSEIGQKCNTRSINRLATNHARLKGNQRDEQTTKRRPAAEAALSSACLSACQKNLKSDGNPLLAARLLLLARLLQNSASKTAQGVRLIGEQRLKVNSLRTKLLIHIDRQVGKLEISRAQMLDLLLAYALVTSSSLSDVFRHVLHIRQECLTELCYQKKRKFMIKAVDLLFVTIEQVKSVFPKRLPERIERTTGPQLLSDPDLRSALDLDLDICERWISKDIRNYVPWLRNNDLSPDVLGSGLEEWSDSAAKTINTGFDSLLQDLTKPSRITKLREIAIRHLLESDTRASGMDKEPLLMAIRTLFVNRLSIVISSSSSSITQVVSILVSDEGGKQHKVDGLWHSELAALDLRNGAASLRQQVTLRSQGHDSTLSKFSEDISTWLTGLDEVRKTIKEMQSLRWADSIDLDTDLEDDGGRYDDMFSKADPDKLKKHLSSEIDVALRNCLDTIKDAAQLVSGGDQSEATNRASFTARSLYLIRALRVLSPHLSSKELVSSADQIATSLHTAIAKDVVQNTTNQQSARHKPPNLFEGVSPITLWSGTPPLPSQPGSRSFRLLRDLSKAMTDVGSDVWVKSAVVAVKIQMREVIAGTIEHLVSEPTSGETAESNDGVEESEAASGEEKDGDTDDKGIVNGDQSNTVMPNGDKGTDEVASTQPQVSIKQKLQQALFDAIYLGEVLDVPEAHKQERMSQAIDRLKSKAEVDQSALQRLSKSAQTYHKRTYLLFGILANS
ncbi:hypothetical protein KVT40_005996 [Elsinoe batatas]|uniref:Conserved oligomeric Golgi complex subunit 1 n=1 Tax=Elsinoe batatas TaxID=2601811 RepID=A0A8K0KYH1_9PEZI|nr:hypothetical protein KVT40_005996 [Elsinoe batatas]